VLSRVEEVGRFAVLEDLWRDALTRGLREPLFRLVRDGATLPPATRRAGAGHRSIDDLIQPNRVLELHAAGATMVLQGLQFTDPHLARTANNLALELDHAVQVNAYFSPAAARGLELHFDQHDVFVLQLAGRKRWRVWEPLERTRLPVRVGARVAMPTFDELGPPSIDRTMQAGDCLYLPRGYPHAAETVDESSAHLTIGVIPSMWHQAVRHAVDEAVAAGALRESIRVDELAVPDLAPVAASLDGLAVRRWMAAEVWRKQPATRLRPLQPPIVDLDTMLEVTPGPLLWLTGSEGRAELGLGDRSLTMPVVAHPLLAAVLRSTGPFALAALDVDLDDDSRVAVGRRLAAEGVIAPA
jgi:hypothetical protein